jgi:ribosomal protein L20
MPRVKGGVVTHRRHKKIIKAAKGHRGLRHKVFRRANESVMHACGTPTNTVATGRATSGGSGS